MSVNATKSDLDKLEKSLDKRFLKMDQKMDKRFDNLIDLMGQFANDTQEKLAEHDDQFHKINQKLLEHDDQFRNINQKLLEHDDEFRKINQKLHEYDEQFRKINQSYDHLLNTIDGFIGRIDQYETELAARDHKIDRLERWIEQIAKKTDVKLV